MTPAATTASRAELPAPSISPPDSGPSPPAIATHHLTKDYGNGRGVFDVTLGVRRGEVFGFLGPNGAGKTTTIRVLMDLIRPTAGNAQILGLDCQRDSVAVKRRVGYLPGELSLFPSLTGGQLLEYLGNLRGGVHHAHVAELAERLDLDVHRPFREYSRGNKQKVGIVQALMHRPPLLILDEPTSGLDPLVQQEFYRLMEEAQASGTTIFLSSHIFSEVERICDRVGILREGRLVHVGEVAALKEIKLRHVEIVFAEPVPQEEFAGLPGVEGLVVEKGTVVRCTVRGDLDAVVKAAARHNVVGFVSHEPSLEEFFLTYYDGALDDGRSALEAAAGDGPQADGPGAPVEQC